MDSPNNSFQSTLTVLLSSTPRRAPALLVGAAVLAAGLLGGCGNRQSSEMSAEQRAAKADTIGHLVETFTRTWNELEPRPYLELFSEDVQFYLRGSRSGRDAFEKGVRGMMAAYQSYTMEPEDPQIRVLGPRSAVGSFQYSGEAVDTSGSSQSVQAAMTLVYERRDGTWSIAQAHESIVPSEQSE